MRCTIANNLIYISISRKKQGEIVAAQNSQEIFDIEGYCTGTGRGKDSGEEGSCAGQVFLYVSKLDSL